MNENVVDTLKIKIVGDSTNAVNSLDKLISTIDRIKSATSGGNKGLSGIDKHLSKISAACDKINAGALSKIYKLADGLRTLNDIGNIKISAKFADRILDLGAAVELLQGLDMSKLTEMADGLKALNSVGQVNIPSPNVGTPVSTPASAVETPPASSFSGTELIQSEIVTATSATIGLKNALSSTASVFSNMKNIASSSLSLMTRSIQSVSSAIGTLATGMAKAGSATLSFAKCVAKGITAPSRMAINAVQGLVGKVGNLFRLFKKRAMYRAMNLVISTITKGFSEGTKHCYEYSKAVGTALAPSMDKLATSGLYLKNSLGAMVAPLMNMLAPAVDKLVDKFVDLLNVINQAFAALSGSSTWTKAIKYPTEYASETNKAAKATDKLKKSILGFDEINPLQDNSKNDNGSGKEGEDYSLMFEEQQVTSFAKDIENVLGGIFKPFKQAWEKEGAKTIKSIQDKFSAMKTFIGTVGNTFAQVWTNGTGETVLSNILQIIQNINQITTNLYTNLTKAWNANGNGLIITQNVMNAVIALQNVVKKFFKSTADWIGKLDFTPIMTSISKLTNKFKPFIDLVGGALLDAYEDVLQPLGTWTIEEAAPATIDALSEAFRALNALLKPVKEGLKDLWQALKPIIEWIENVAIDIINGFKTVFSKVADVFEKKGGTIKDIFKGIGDAVKGAWKIIEPIFLMLKDLASATFEFLSEFIGNNLGDVIDALKGIVDFIAGVFTGDWSRAWDGIKNIFSGCWNVIKDLAGVIWDAIVQIFKSAWEGIKSVFAPVGGFFNTVWEAIKKVFTPVVGVFKTIFSGAWTAIKVVWNGAKAYFSALWNGIKTVFSSVGTWFKSIFSGAWNLIKGVFGGVASFFKGVWNGIKAIFQGVAGWFKGIFSGAWSAIKGVFGGVASFFKGIWNGIKGVFNGVKDFFKNTFGGAWNLIKGIWNAVKGFFKGIWDGIKAIFQGKPLEFFKNVFGGAWNAIKSIWSGVKGFFQGIWNGIKSIFKGVGSWFKSIFQGAKNAIASVWNGVVGFFKKIWDGIKKVFSKVGEFFRSIFQGAKNAIASVWNGVTGFFKKIWEGIKAVFNKVITFFKNVFGGAKDAIVGIWTTIRDFIVECWNTIKNIFNAMTGTASSALKDKTRESLKKQGKTYTDEEWEKAWKTGKFASGGIVNEGQMFIAREAGPELVGNIGNRTAVMNNDQIVNSVARGVADANAEQNALLREEIGILRKILAKDFGSGGNNVDILGELSRINRRNGKTVVSIGV